MYRALLRENRTLQRFQHPYIVAYLGYEELVTEQATEARLYLEYCEGGDLQKSYVKLTLPSSDALDEEEEEEDYELAQRFLELNKVENLKEAEMWDLIYQLFAALAYLHYGLSISEEGACRFEHNWDPVVHRDIKPHNGKHFLTAGSSF